MPSTTLVLGGTGATGMRLVEQLIDANQNVRTIVRSKERLHQMIPANDLLTVTEASLVDMEDADFERCMKDCDAVVSCLGHNLTFKGMYRDPLFVSGVLKRACETIGKIQPSKPTKVILMGSDGVANPDGKDPQRKSSERCIISVVRALVPPHRDNEAAVSYLSDDIGTDDKNIQWVVVRPTDLIQGDVSSYTTNERPECGLFGDGVTTRANVAHFMKDLIMDESKWKEW
eukprot:CAMPEP_0197235738 /NCGR_PEP_ID=MMETSP1429-20130617/3095_1 /TAXON_ID=49237 /ORGANISM="Chaetoceros  sp., Strain UNC1202" /LENGTH=229 /DNA_ID=CAMNT_0042694405 /DNA_START=88 /DNA_END=774 /DNA_ORIENTATION=+